MAGPFELARRYLGSRSAIWAMGGGAAGLAILASIPFYSVGNALSKGEWVAQQSFAPWMGIGAAVTGAMAFSVIGFVVYSVHYNRWKKTWFRIGLFIVFGFLSVVMTVADVVVLPQQYAGFHYLLYGISVFFASVLAVNLMARFKHRFPFRWALGLGILAILLMVFAAGKTWRMSAPVRAEVGSVSPLTGVLVKKMVPDLPQNALILTLKNLKMDRPDKKPAPRGLLKVGDDWNIILAVVDTMRADVLPPVRKGKLEFADPSDTPFLNQWLNKTVRFSRNYAPANKTKNSMPAIFHSNDAYTKRSANPSLPATMKQLGRTPIAVVNNYFLEPRTKRTQALLHDFEYVDVYDRGRMQDQVGKMIKAMDTVKSQPFFAWFHFYALHSPCFAGTGLLTDDPSSYAQKYRKALKWIDSELRDLFTGIEKLGIAHKTIIVLTADHGEGHYSHGFRTHGSFLFDEEVRVPLDILIPGHNGHVVDTTVGSIDILPTFIDLLGGEADGRHHGRSLVPLIAEPHRTWRYPYYLKSSKGNLSGVVSGTDKLIYNAEANLFARYDLAADPDEKKNLYNENSPKDQSLVSVLASKSPRVFEDELQDPKTLQLLLERLTEVDQNTSAHALQFLLRLCRSIKGDRVDEALATLFRETQSDRVRLLVAKTGFSIDKKAWTRTLSRHMKKIPFGKRQLSFIETASAVGMPSFSQMQIARLMRWWIRKKPISYQHQWLGLVANWKKLNGKWFGPVFAELLQKVAKSKEIDIPLVTKVAQKVAVLSRTSSRNKTRLTWLLIPYLTQKDVPLKVAVLKALHRVGNKKMASPALRRLLEDPTLSQYNRVVQSTILTIAKLEGVDAVPLILKHGSRPFMVRDTVALLGKLKAKEGLAYLENVNKTHHNTSTRGNARKAIKAIEEHTAKLEKQKDLKDQSIVPTPQRRK